MDDLMHSRRSFAERLRDAVEEGAATASAERKGRHRHQRRRTMVPVSAPVANPRRVRHSDELFTERLRRALD